MATPFEGTWNTASFVTMLFIRDNNTPRTIKEIKRWMTDHGMGGPSAKTLTLTIKSLPLKRVQPGSPQYVLDLPKVRNKCFGGKGNPAPGNIKDME